MSRDSVNGVISIPMFLYFSIFLFSLDLNAAESGVQHKPAKKGGQSPFPQENQQSKENCSC